MGETITIGIADMNIATRGDILITYALGSCVGICLYDSVAGVMGLSHVLLPKNSLCPNDHNYKKFADTALTELVNMMKMKGASVFRMSAKIAGGAQMFESKSLRIGERNVETVVSELKRLGIKLMAADVGDNYGRTMECHAQDGTVIIKSMSRGSHFL